MVIDKASRISRLVPALVFAAAAMLAACGGGGGDSPSAAEPESPGGAGSQSGGGLSLSASPASLIFSGTATSTVEPPTQQISIATSGGAVYLDVRYAGVAHEAAPVQLRDAAATVAVRVPAPSIVGAGVHTGTVTIRGYRFAFGGSEVAGSPRAVSVTYGVAGLAANPAGLVFNQFAGSFPPSQTVTLSDGLDPGASDAWSATLELAPITNLTIPNWLQVSPLSGGTLPATLTVSVVAQGQAGIEYDGFINVTTVASGYTKRIRVIYRAQ